MATLYHSRVFQYHTIPLVLSIFKYQSYHYTIPWLSQGGWGPLSKNWKYFYWLLYWSALYRPVLDSFLNILSHEWSLSSEINAFKRIECRFAWYKIYAYTLLGTILYRLALDKFLSISSHKWSFSSEINAFKKELDASLLDTKSLPTLSPQDNELSTSQLEISSFY
jgi:hypothetical protein